MEKKNESSVLKETRCTLLSLDVDEIMDFQKDLRAVIVNMKNDVPLRLGLKHVRVND